MDDHFLTGMHLLAFILLVVFALTLVAQPLMTAIAPLMHVLAG